MFSWCSREHWNSRIVPCGRGAPRDGDRLPRRAEQTTREPVLKGAPPGWEVVWLDVGQGDYVVILRDGTRLTSSRGYRSNLQEFMNRSS